MFWNIVPLHIFSSKLTWGSHPTNFWLFFKVWFLCHSVSTTLPFSSKFPSQTGAADKQRYTVIKVGDFWPSSVPADWEPAALPGRGSVLGYDVPLSVQLTLAQQSAHHLLMPHPLCFCQLHRPCPHPSLEPCWWQRSCLTLLTQNHEDCVQWRDYHWFLPCETWKEGCWIGWERSRCRQTQTVTKQDKHEINTRTPNSCAML